MAVRLTVDCQVLNCLNIFISTYEACALDCYRNNKEEAGNCDYNINNQLSQGCALAKFVCHTGIYTSQYCVDQVFFGSFNE